MAYKPKKLSLSQFLEPPMVNLETAQQKLFYAGLRACANDEGILSLNLESLRLQIFGSLKIRCKDLSNDLSYFEKHGYIFRYKAEGRDYLVLPYHFEHEGKIQYFSPSEYPRPPKEFSLRNQHYAKELKIHMERVEKSAEGGQRGSSDPLDPSGRPRGGSEGARGGSEGARGSGIEKLRPVLKQVFKKHHIPYDPLTLKPLNVSHSEKTLNSFGGDWSGSDYGEIQGKRESLKGEKGQEGEITLQHILNVCGDEHSKEFYKLVVKRCPRQMIGKALIETECVIQEKKLRTTPGRYFTGLIKKLAAKERISLDGSKKT